MFVRFVVARQHPDTGVQTGIFEATRQLPRVGHVADWNEARLAEIITWFRTHLPFPERVARSRRPNGHHAAVSWFRASASEHIAMARELAARSRWRTYACTVLAGEATPGGGEGPSAALTDVCWVSLDATDWSADIVGDRHLYPQLLTLRNALAARAADDHP